MSPFLQPRVAAPPELANLTATSTPPRPVRCRSIRRLPASSQASSIRPLLRCLFPVLPCSSLTSLCLASTGTSGCRRHAERSRPNWIHALRHRPLSCRPSSPRIGHAGSRRCQILAWSPGRRSSTLCLATSRLSPSRAAGTTESCMCRLLCGACGATGPRNGCRPGARPASSERMHGWRPRHQRSFSRETRLPSQIC